MTVKKNEIESIHLKTELEAGTFGAKAQKIRQLVNIGLSIPTGFFISKNVVAHAGITAKKNISQIIGNLSGLYSLRASPTDRNWGSIDAILNLGMSDTYIQRLEVKVGKWGSLEIYKRFIHNFSISVYGLEPEIFEKICYDQMRLMDVEDESLLDEKALDSIVSLSKQKFREELGFEFPQSLQDQVDLAFSAMSMAWHRPSAKILRAARGAPDDAGLGMILQEMVLGIGKKFSGSGQINTVDPESGQCELTGCFLPNSQGNDARMGFRVPHMLSKQQMTAEKQTQPSLECLDSNSFNTIRDVIDKTAIKLGDFFDFEFTISNNVLYFLDAAIAERSARASVKLAVDLVTKNALTEEQALLKIEPYNLLEFLHPQISSNSVREVLGVGLPASPGAISGQIVFSSQSAHLINLKGGAAILVRVETTPEDISGIHDSVGVLTSRGGMTSHAAVIARGLGLPCVVGVSTLSVNISEKNLLSDGGRIFKEGDFITLDGTVGEVLEGSVEMTQPEISGSFLKLMEWADRHRSLGVRANADTPQEAQLAKDFGADGIGLCRTEHMFFEQKRLLVMREMILAEGELDRRNALAKLLPMQRDDFIKFFQIMKGQPVTIRLLDPPLHEFLPHSEAEMALIAKSMNVTLKYILDRSKDLEEFNPMLGKRGVRLGITMPEIYEMQARAIFEAVECVREEGGDQIVPEIMIPLVSTDKEVELIKKSISSISEEIWPDIARRINYKLGVVVETPRAALKAQYLSELSDFLSFGTNDLTQMTYGLSRDDAGGFMRDYLEKGVFPNDPFHSLDLEGVGELILIAVKRSRAVKKQIELGLCGEHGGDPSSIRFCLDASFDYVSCSPFRIPIARLAAAQASIIKKIENVSRNA
ncbi:pyruvate, phosphate dikinase [Rhodobacteraceae bacterium]|nr:pyruvate, phosphate dikinase [Paracoccaceae bacterium]